MEWSGTWRGKQLTKLISAALSHKLTSFNPSACFKIEREELRKFSRNKQIRQTMIEVQQAQKTQVRITQSSPNGAAPLTRSDSEDDDDSSMELTRCGPDDSNDSLATTEEYGPEKNMVDIPSLLDPSRQFQEHLKYIAEGDEHASNNDTRQHCVHFHTTVSGVIIPRASDYPLTIRQKIWASFEEIQANANRNIIEFRADNWDWKMATEENCMVLESLGKLVHPATFKPRKMSAQKRKYQSERKKVTARRRRRARQYAN